ncbi:ribonuclease-3 family protein [Anaerobranca californiensis DSM 14826]|uniref:Mini-ribonuclease 3 n=1 Tax=Anaerobranca californiensis DSM 14826 TaxID=1120989 RepID=A0A1M6QYG2_9FIRM|nr:ribonuclease III domain-containing protein [Anaerobranca californiensis]SHK25265.1 ribonuclease-3 family protein [Anaerobranca californiensis DSM 14826]
MEKNKLEQEVPVLALAFVGDAVYDTFIRSMLIKQGKVKPNLLHKRATLYNKAKAQSLAFLKILPFLNDKEKQIAMRGRNVKGNTIPKSATVKEYKNATGLEALIGYLHLARDINRLEEIMNTIVDIIEGEGVEMDYES